MPLPPKPKLIDVTNSDFGPVSDSQSGALEVLVRTITEDAALTARIVSGAPFFAISNFEIDELQIVQDLPPSGEHQIIRTWEEVMIASSDGSQPLGVAAGTRMHVRVSLTVPPNRLPAGPVNGILAIEGGTSPISVTLTSAYTPTPPADQGHPGVQPPDGGTDSGTGNDSAKCDQLRQDRTNQDREMALFQQKLKNTPGPDGPGSARAPLEQAIATLAAEIAATVATMSENGCVGTPIGPRTSTFTSPVYGPVSMQGALRSRWLDLASQNTVNGQTVQEFLGQPVRPPEFVEQTNRQLDVQEFEHGAIINIDGNDMPFVVYGAIYTRYRQLGGWDGFLGAPTSDELDANLGRISGFEGGAIIWDPVSGTTHEVHGPILDRWVRLNGAGGPLGYPVTDEVPILSQGAQIGSFQMFQGPGGTGAAIYLSPATGASEIFGPIMTYWLKTMGGPMGAMGFPAAAQSTTPAGTAFHQFQKGLVVNTAGALPQAITGGLELQLFSCTVEDSFNVQIVITTSTGQNNTGRLPASGEFDAGSHAFGPDTELTVPAVDQGVNGVSIPPDLTINVEMQAISENTIGSDTLEGKILATYNMDNAWGLLEASSSHQDGGFTAVFAIQPTDRFAVADDLAFRQLAFWPFNNFTPPDMSWEQYEQTYADVAETDKHISLDPLHPKFHIFEIIFYETVYRSMGAPGVCFGMCLESIYARANRSLFLEPIFSSNSYALDGYATNGARLDMTKPNSVEVGNQIIVKHGYQLGAECANYVLDKWTAGALHDPVRAFRESRDMNARGDWSLLTVSTETEFNKEGHAVLPYFWKGDDSPILPGQTWEILCANPNNPASLTPDNEDDHCKIIVKPFEQEFVFHFGNDSSAGSFWTGSSQSGGRLLAVPFSVLCSQPVTLGAEIVALLASAVLILVGDGATSTQMTDEKGRTLFTTSEVPAASGSGTTTIQVVNPDVATRVPNLMPVPHREAMPTPTGGPELFYWQRDAGPMQGKPAADTSAMELHHDVQSPVDTPYRYTMRSNASLTSITGDRGSPAGHRFSMHNIGTAAQKVVVHPPADGTTTNFQIQSAGWQANRSAPIWYEFAAAVSAGQEMHFHVGNAGTQLSVMSANADAALDITMFTRGSDATVPPISVSRSQVPIPAGQVHRFEPDSWKIDELAASPVRVSVLNAFGGGTVVGPTAI